jgi:hypothetical protein
MDAIRQIWNAPDEIYLPHLPFTPERIYTEREVAALLNARVYEETRPLTARIHALESEMGSFIERANFLFQTLSKPQQPERKETRVPAVYVGKKTKRE